MEKAKLITGQCPHCKTQLCIEEGETITCPSCDVVVSADEISRKGVRGYDNVFGEEKNNASSETSQYAVYIENPTSGLAYLENRFETNDWDEYESSLIFELDDVDTVVEKNKVTNADNPDTWLLEFKSVVVPMTHKISGVSKIVDNIVKNYNPFDLTNSFELFDDYIRITNAITERKESVFRTIDADIKFMEKFKISSASLSEVKKEYNSFKALYDSVVVVNQLEELPEVGKAMAKIQKEISDNLATKGIDAEATYQEALELYNNQFDIQTTSELVLSKFQSIKGYKDSSTYIRKINTLSRFEDIIETDGKLYYVAINKNSDTFNVKAPSESLKKGGSGCGTGKSKSKAPIATEEVYKGKTMSLYKVKDMTYDPATPIIEKISAVLTSYNGKLFYISEDKLINVIKLSNNSVKNIDFGKVGSYSTLSNNDERRFVWGKDRQSIFIKKRLDTRPAILSNKGCSKKSEEAPKVQLNNFSLLKVDLENSSATTVVKEMVDIMDVYGDYIFFTQSRDVTKTVTDKKGRNISVTEPQTFFSSYNLVTGEIVDMLDENVCIIGAADGKVVYSTYSPVTYNMDLYVYDVENSQSTLLEKNIYEATKIHDGKVLYTVGSFSRRSLFSIKLDGTERTEIMLNVERIQWFDKNWMYVIKGYGYNRILVKISYDGKKRVVVAVGIERLIKMTAGFIYYVDYDGSLYMVRTDGKKRTRITNDCEDAKIVIDTDRIILLNSEGMDYNGKVVKNSLYEMDLQGHNLKKIYYDVLNMAEIDETRIFFVQSEVKKYKITTPQQKGPETVSYVSSTVKTYYSYDRFTHETTKLFVLGEPKEKNFEFKSGCFGRKVLSAHSIIEEVTKKQVYERTGKMTPGQAAAEETKKAEEKNSSPLSSVQSVAGRGTNASNNNGCSGCSGNTKKK